MFSAPRSKNLNRLVLATCMALACGEATPDAELTPQMLRTVLPSAPPTSNGQTATLLQTGDWLLTGGEEGGEHSAAAFLLKVATSRRHHITPFRHARSGHTATVLPGGPWLVLGGTPSVGRLVHGP